MHISTVSLLKKRYLLVFIAVTATFGSFAKKGHNVARPKLVVGIVVDQMRWDYLYRYYNNYSNSGFRRLMDNGYSCQNTMINYLPSYTAPGHSCVYTGSVPSIHGIAANDWFDTKTGKSVYCTDDTVREVNNGIVTDRKSMSPRNLLVTTVTDELRLATNFKSRVYGVAVKDRGSILPAGHLANGAYWLDDSTGSFCSSTYYKESAPQWLLAFNKRNVADSLVKNGWDLKEPVADYWQSAADDNPYEGKIKGEIKPVFPHDVSKLAAKDRYNAFKAMPGSNTLTLQAAMACREGEHLGEGDLTDFLAVSLSGTDYTGHMFGPNSMEVQDVYMRLDNDLALFLAYLDKALGKDNYTIFLTADHGAAHNPQYLLDNNIPAGYLSKDYKSEVNKYLERIYNTSSIVKYYTNYQLYINDSVLRAANLDETKVRTSIVDYLGTMPEFTYVADLKNIDRTALPEPIRTMIINGYNRDRSGSIQMIPAPGWFEGHSKTGTTHGTWNPYDTHIPLLWYGYGITAGETNEVTQMTDIAPTLAALLHIQMPNGCIGRPIKSVLHQ